MEFDKDAVEILSHPRIAHTKNDIEQLSRKLSVLQKRDLKNLEFLITGLKSTALASDGRRYLMQLLDKITELNLISQIAENSQSKAEIEYEPKDNPVDLKFANNDTTIWLQIRREAEIRSFNELSKVEGHINSIDKEILSQVECEVGGDGNVLAACHKEPINITGEYENNFKDSIVKASNRFNIGATNKNINLVAREIKNIGGHDEEDIACWLCGTAGGRTCIYNRKRIRLPSKRDYNGLFCDDAFKSKISGVLILKRETGSLIDNYVITLYPNNLDQEVIRIIKEMAPIAKTYANQIEYNK